jgi:hypothetical protein
MNKSVFCILLVLLNITPVFANGAYLQQAPGTQSIATPVQGQPTPQSAAPVAGGQKVKLYFLREAAKIAAILKEIAKLSGSELSGLIIADAAADEIILYGPEEARNKARQLIATLDLPRPGIRMEMWGIQLSSSKPEDMAAVMLKVRREIDHTQEMVREAFIRMERLARERITEMDPEFARILQGVLKYRTALSANRPLSLTDILLRMIAAKEPLKAVYDFADGLNSWLETPENQHYAKALATTGRRPFERFLRTRGLYYRNNRLVEENGSVTGSAAQGRAALLEFALHYGRLVHSPENFSPYYLQQSTEILNSRLQAAVDALNLDLQDLFIVPTLDNIRAIVREFKDVEYAQVGKTSVASLSGISTEVSSKSVSAFDVTPPLRLSELLSKAKTLSDSAAPFIPDATQPGATTPTERLVGTMPLAQIIGLIAAFGEERSVWRELQAGVSITLTPAVLRNMTSAELQVSLKTGDPQAGSREAGVRPLSRVSQHDVKTSIYVNALDFFDLSAFVSQSTLNGGRGYVPIIGPIWRGLFGEIPMFGTFFSWKRGAKTVYHESLVLTMSSITPTAMGVAVLYPTERFNPDTGEQETFDDAVFKDQLREVSAYKQRTK